VISAQASISHLSKFAAYLRRDWLRILFLLTLGVIVRAPALQGERIWDDDYLSYDSPFIKSPLLILEAFRHYLFPDSLSVHYRPMQNISYITDYFFWNTDTWGFHLTNVLLHATSGVLLYFLLRQLLASLLFQRASIAVRDRLLRRFPWISIAAFLVALIWIVHPVHSAAVDYISGRADSLAFLFSSGGWLLFLRARRTPHTVVRALLYLIAAGLGLLALCSREIALIWMALFVAHLLFIDKKTPVRARVWTIICCLALVAVYIGLRQLPAQRPRAPLNDNWSAPVRLTMMTRALGDYSRLMLVPLNLHMERTVFDPRGYRSKADWRNQIGIEYLSICGLIALVALVFGSAKRGRGQLVRIFGASWFFAGYLPVSNIVQLNATVAEHWLYLPSVGFLMFVAGCVVEIPQRFWKVAVALALVATTGLSVRSYLRSTDWVTAETFFCRTFAASGITARAGVNLGQIYANRGDYTDAEKIFRKVLETLPDYPVAQNNLATCLSHRGKTAEAEALFALIAKASVKTRKEYPRTWIGALNLARLRCNFGDHNSAIAIVEQARKDYPEVWELISFESELVRETQGPDAALHLVENFARKNWWHHGAALALGRLYAQRGDVAAADAALRCASWLDVHDAEALRLIAQIRLRQNRLDDAFRAQRRAVARQPDEPRQYTLLSDILERMGRGAEAHAALVKASQLRALAVAQPIGN
jgi:Flp pilus assembly protein TadD